MKFNLPRITRPLLLTDYAPELVDESGQPATIYVWVNPPRDRLAEHDARLGDGGRLTPELAAWYAELWSQHPDAATHWTADEVLALTGQDTDPALFRWLQAGSLRLIGEHRSGERKNS